MTVSKHSRPRVCFVIDWQREGGGDFGKAEKPQALSWEEESKAKQIGA